MNSLSCYDYDLPKDLIAQHPLPYRTDSRLLVVDRQKGAITHHSIQDLSRFLHEGDTLVFNDTKVIPARLVGHRKSTGGRWFGLFLSSDET
ncbi:MAG: S-adenosylmethionine:tRNA ribosyltransferase-isomerase, partial [Pirellulaceae bacterium]|nr:S-adenosylmethionine:tRNA ribosyltransferase-isomerase [Pirellulaceae bacterium]